MSRLTVQSMIALLLVAVVSSTLLAAGNVIGVVSAEGTFRLDNVAASDHATIFDGNVIQTEATAPTVNLSDGGRIQFGPHSRARISGRVVELQQGYGEVSSARGYEVSTKALLIEPANQRSVARVEVQSDRRILVAAVNAPVRVKTRTNVVLAEVAAGTTLSFEPQGGDATNISGCLLQKNGRFVIVDPAGKKIIAEVRGADVLPAQVGNQVTITGNAIPGSTGVDGVQVVGETALVKTLGPSQACVAAATAVGANVPAGPVVPGKPATGGGTAAASHTTAYVIAGVAVAGGAIGGIAATRGSSSNK